MTTKEFVTEAIKIKDKYKRYDAYVQKFAKWDQDSAFENYASAAGLIFSATKRTRLGIILLGDEGIRQMKDLLINFGLASETGIQDKELKALIDEARDFRDDMNRNANPKVNKSNTWFSKQRKQDVYESILGKGSILSDKSWTTILNDGLIFGGIESGHEFHLALSNNPTKATTMTLSEQAIWANYTKLAKIQQQSPGNLTNKNIWKSAWINFLNENSGMLFNDKTKNPRVLARELLGLKFFGYAPSYSPHQLTFHRRNIVKLSLEKYLDSLNSVGFFNPINIKENVMRAVNDFLENY